MMKRFTTLVNLGWDMGTDAPSLLTGLKPAVVGRRCHGSQGYLLQALVLCQHGGFVGLLGGLLMLFHNSSSMN